MERFGIKDFDKLQENNQLEVKQAVKGLPNLWDTYSAFANTFGGTILLGVKEEDDGSFTPVKIENPDHVLKDFYSLLNDPKKVSVNLIGEKDVVVRKEGEYTLIEIHVPQAERHFRPVYINGNPYRGTYRRNYEGDYLCPESEVKAMIADSLDQGDGTPVAPLSALEEESYLSYRQRFQNLHPDHPFLSLGKEDFLLRLGAARRGKGSLGLTKEGLLFFGKGEAIESLFPYYFLDYTYYLSHDLTAKYADRVYSGSGYWSGNLYDFLNLVLQHIRNNAKDAFLWKPGDVQREEDTLLFRAIREGVVNAFSNVDFSYSQGLCIRHYPDEIVIENPGLLRLPKSEVLEGGHSDPLNPIIQKLLAFLNFGERTGSGFPLMESALKQSGLPALRLEEKVSPDRTILTLPLTKASAPQEEAKPTETLAGEEDAMLAKMKEAYGASSFTRKDICSLFHISESKATLFLRSLKESGKIRLAPLSKARNYVIND